MNLSRAIKTDIEDLINFIRIRSIKSFDSFKRNVKMFFHIHKCKHESTERGKITLFKNFMRLMDGTEIIKQIIIGVLNVVSLNLNSHNIVTKPY